MTAHCFSGLPCSTQNMRFARLQCEMTNLYSLNVNASRFWLEWMGIAGASCVNVHAIIQSINGVDRGQRTDNQIKCIRKWKLYIANDI